MKRFFLNAGTLGLVLATLGVSLSVATAAIGARAEGAKPVTYIGEHFSREQQSLRSQPDAEMHPTF